MKTEQQIEDKIKEIRKKWSHNMGLMNFFYDGQLKILQWVIKDDRI